MYLKLFWTQLENLYLQGSCCLRPCSSRPCCTFISMHLHVYKIISFHCASIGLFCRVVCIERNFCDPQNPLFKIKIGLCSRASYNGACTVHMLFLTLYFDINFDDFLELQIYAGPNVHVVHCKYRTYNQHCK